jgi:hypothetical protein
LYGRHLYIPYHSTTVFSNLHPCTLSVMVAINHSECISLFLFNANRLALHPLSFYFLIYVPPGTWIRNRYCVMRAVNQSECISVCHSSIPFAKISIPCHFIFWSMLPRHSDTKYCVMRAVNQSECISVRHSSIPFAKLTIPCHFIF